jgi:hypothetical protein
MLHTESFHRRKTGLAGLALAASAFAGCCAPTTGQLGELGHARFRYECLSDSDIACPPRTYGDSSAVIPGEIALDATFGLVVVGDYASIKPASADFVAAIPGGFRTLRPGMVSMIAYDHTGALLDYVQLHIASMAGIALEAPQDAAPRVMKVGATETWWPTPVDAGGGALSGSVEFTWTSTAPEVVGVSPPAYGGGEQITARLPGHAVVRVSHGDIALDIDVTVAP